MSPKAKETLKNGLIVLTKLVAFASIALTWVISVERRFEAQAGELRNSITVEEIHYIQISESLNHIRTTVSRIEDKLDKKVDK